MFGVTESKPKNPGPDNRLSTQPEAIQQLSCHISGLTTRQEQNGVCLVDHLGLPDW